MKDNDSNQNGRYFCQGNDFFVFSEITFDLVSEVIRSCNELLSACNSPVICISSKGGDSVAGNVLADFILANEVETVAMGDVESAAVTVFLAGKKRYLSSPRVTFMTHATGINLLPQEVYCAGEINAYGDFIGIADKQMERFFCEVTGKDWHGFFKQRPYYFGEKVARRQGMITEEGYWSSDV